MANIFLSFIGVNMPYLLFLIISAGPKGEFVDMIGFISGS